MTFEKPFHYAFQSLIESLKLTVPASKENTKLFKLGNKLAYGIILY